MREGMRLTLKTSILPHIPDIRLVPGVGLERIDNPGCSR